MYYQLDLSRWAPDVPMPVTLWRPGMEPGDVYIMYTLYIYIYVYMYKQ